MQLLFYAEQFRAGESYHLRLTQGRCSFSLHSNLWGRTIGRLQAKSYLKAVLDPSAQLESGNSLTILIVWVIEDESRNDPNITTRNSNRLIERNLQSADAPTILLNNSSAVANWGSIRSFFLAPCFNMDFSGLCQPLSAGGRWSDLSSFVTIPTAC